MTVHMVRIRSEFPDGVTVEEIQQEVDYYLNNNHPTLREQEMSIREYVPPEDGAGVRHLIGDFRFTLENTKDELLREAESRLQRVVSWYVLQYHGCPHDETGECSWDAEVTWGPVPSGVTG